MTVAAISCLCMDFTSLLYELLLLLSQVCRQQAGSYKSIWNLFNFIGSPQRQLFSPDFRIVANIHREAVVKQEMMNTSRVNKTAADFYQFSLNFVSFFG